MKIATPNVLTLKDVVFTVGTDDYARQVDNVTFTPSSSQITWQGMSPDASFSDSSNTTWVCAISGAQDWDDEDSLCNYLLENEGDLKAVVFKPRAGSGPSFQANITLAAPAIGGAVNAVATFSVSCGVTGRPVKVATPTP